MKPIGIFVLTVATLASFLPPPAAAETASLSPECEMAVRDAHAYLRANLQQIPIDAAIRALVDRVGGPCGLTLAGPLPVHADERALGRLVAELSGGPAPAASSSDTAETVDPIGLIASLVPCDLPGAGSGTLEAYLLGIPVHPLYGGATAHGQWKTVPEGAQVAGTLGALSGEQVDATGVMEFGPVGIPAVEEGTSTTCAEVVTGTTVEQTCIWLIFVIQCTQTVTVQSKLIPCEAFATQRALLGLANMNHHYSTGEQGCPT